MPAFWILSLITSMAASSRRRGSSFNSMLVKPSAFTNSRLASEKFPKTPNLGFQLGMRFRCAWAAAAADMAVSTVRREIFISQPPCAGCRISHKLPALAEMRHQVLVRLGLVGEPHLGRVPIQFALELHGDDAQKHPLDERRGHREIGAGGFPTLASANPIPVMSRRPGQHLGRQLVILHPRVGHETGSLAVTAGCDKALVADENASVNVLSLIHISE